MFPETWRRRWGLQEAPFLHDDADRDPLLDRVDRWAVHGAFERLHRGPEAGPSALVFGLRGSGKSALRRRIGEAKRGPFGPLVVELTELDPWLEELGRRRGPDHLPTEAAALVLLTPSLAAQSFDYPDFSSLTNLSLVERAAQLGTVMRVHDTLGTGGNNRGAMWYDQPVNVVGGFSTTFEFQMTGAGSGDGMAFVVQNESIAGTHGGVGVTGIGRHAAACGYGMFATSVAGESIENSIAIELDTYTNGNWGDANNNHISVHTGGTGDNETGEDFSIGRTGFLSVDLNDSQVHTLTVNYVPGTLEVVLDGVSVLTTAYDFNTGGTWVDSGNAVGGLDLINGTSAWVGVTASSGGSVENHDVLSWSFSSGAPSSLFCSPANAHSGGQSVTLANSGGGAAGGAEGGCASRQVSLSP